jgi:hypothetical protein
MGVVRVVSVLRSLRARAGPGDNSVINGGERQRCEAKGWLFIEYAVNLFDNGAGLMYDADWTFNRRTGASFGLVGTVQQRVPLSRHGRSRGERNFPRVVKQLPKGPSIILSIFSDRVMSMPAWAQDD